MRSGEQHFLMNANTYIIHAIIVHRLLHAQLAIYDFQKYAWFIPKTTERILKLQWQISLFPELLWKSRADILERR